MSDELPSAPPLSGNEVPTTRRATPNPVRLAAVGVLVLAVVNLADIAVAVSSRSLVVDRLRSSTAGSRLTGSQLDIAATTSVVTSAVISVAFAALLVWLGIKVLSGRNWARVAVTVLLGLGVLSTAYSLTTASAASAGALVLEAVSAVLSVLVLVLLWAPAAARAHFAKRPAG